MTWSRVSMTAILSAVTLIVAACAPTPPPPPPSPAIPGAQSISERTVLTEATDLAFPSGGYQLNPAGRADLDRIVPALQAQSGKIVVYGYTDDVPVGAALQRQGIVDNLDLSTKRANEVVRYLESKGINPKVISSKGRGDTHPIASNATPEGRAQNRRIEVVVEQTVEGPSPAGCIPGWLPYKGLCYPASDFT